MNIQDSANANLQDSGNANIQDSRGGAFGLPVTHTGMVGINNATGKHLGGIAHLKQSIRDILTTPIGTRVMRRDYGSRLFGLIDAPVNGVTIIDIVAATAEALGKWEPRFTLERVVLDGADGNGRITLALFGKYRPDGSSIRLDGIVL